MRRHEPTWVRLRVAAIVAALLLALAGGAFASGNCIPGVTSCPTPTPAPTAQPTAPPDESPSPSPSVEPSASPTATPIVPQPSQPGLTPAPSPTPKGGKGTPAPTGSPGAQANAALPPGLSQPSFDIPQLARSAPKNTLHLVDELTPLTKYGFSLQQVLIQGMGRFPVAGVAFWHDDWLEPRTGPPPHLHHGLDIFADFGTPIRAPDDGEITGFGDGSTDPLGGNHIYLRGSDGIEYYFAHVMAFAQGLYVGQPVKIGTVIGFVGNTGDAQDGPPHLHFEIHDPGPIPPKPSVDKWLADAEAYAPTWVNLEIQALTSRNGGAHASLTAPPSPGAADLDTTMLLTLLDPVGGSVGLLPRLNLPQPSVPVSTALWSQLIEMRLDGHIFVPGGQGASQSD